MTITVTLTADPKTNAGVNFNAAYTAFFAGFTPYGFPIFNRPNASRTTQIVHLDTPVPGREAATKAVLLNGDKFAYTFSNHSVSGELNAVSLVTLGPAYDARTGELVLNSNGVVSTATQQITFSGLNMTNAVGVKGEVHNVVAGLMGGGPEGTKADPAPLTAKVWGEAHNVVGSTGADRYVGTQFADVVRGNGGTDTLYGAAGNDRIFGDAGSDTLFGDAGNDALNGNTGNDRLNGGAGNDTLTGETGNDILNGDGGNDRLIGGAGVDTLNGGAGSDVFVFTSVADSTPSARDIIQGFDGIGAAAGDRIDLSAIDANPSVAGNQAFTFGSQGIGGVWLTQSGAETLVNVNIDSDAAAEMVIRIVDGAASHTQYVAGDFIL